MRLLAGRCAGQRRNSWCKPADLIDIEGKALFTEPQREGGDPRSLRIGKAKCVLVRARPGSRSRHAVTFALIFAQQYTGGARKQAGTAGGPGPVADGDLVVAGWRRDDDNRLVVPVLQGQRVDVEIIVPELPGCVPAILRSRLRPDQRPAHGSTGCSVAPEGAPLQPDCHRAVRPAWPAPGGPM